MRFFGTRLEKVMLCNRKVQLLNFAKQEGWDVSQYSIEITYRDLKNSLMRTAAYLDAQEKNETQDQRFNK
jgi:hypothetical protein